MATFKISEEIKDQIYFQGRIFWEEDMAVMGYTNTSFTVHFKGTKISALLRTGVNEEVNYPAVRVYVDGAEYPNMLKEIILKKREEEFVLAEFPEAGEHTVRIGGTSCTFTNAEGYAATACYSDAAVEG